LGIHVQAGGVATKVALGDRGDEGEKWEGQGSFGIPWY